MSECKQVEQANDLASRGANEDFATAARLALQEVNQLRVLNSPTQAKAIEAAPVLQEAGVYSAGWTTPDGAHVQVNQDHGRVVSMSVEKGERSEGTWFQRTMMPLPAFASIHWNCNGQTTRSSFVFDSRGNVIRNSINFPSGLEFEYDANGKVSAIRRER